MKHPLLLFSPQKYPNIILKPPKKQKNEICHMGKNCHMPENITMT